MFLLRFWPRWIVSWCLFNSYFLTKKRPQLEHSNVFSPVCFLVWASILLFQWCTKVHWSHFNTIFVLISFFSIMLHLTPQSTSNETRLDNLISINFTFTFPLNVLVNKISKHFHYQVCLLNRNFSLKGVVAKTEIGNTKWAVWDPMAPWFSPIYHPTIKSLKPWNPPDPWYVIPCLTQSSWVIMGLIWPIWSE